MVYPHFAQACIDRGGLLSRVDDPNGALLNFGCSKLVATQRERVERYADRELFDVEPYAKQQRYVYVPDDPDSVRAVMRLQERDERKRQQRA